MANYVLLPQTTTELPLLNQELIWADVGSIIYTTTEKELLVNAITKEQAKQIKFHTCVNSVGVYPRFQPDDYVYKVFPDKEITPIIDPTKIFPIDFYSLTDQISLELLDKSKNYENVCVFWSGGIDSTFGLSAILKNWPIQDLDRLIVCCNDESIKENTEFYRKFIDQKLRQVSMNDFVSGKIKFTDKNLYSNFETIEALMGYTDIAVFDDMYPSIFNKKFKNHTKEILSYFGNDEFAYYTYQRILRSIRKNSIEAETVFDFLSWIDFNWAIDDNIYRSLHEWGLIEDSVDARKFMINNIFDWGRDTRYQIWRIGAIGTNLLIDDKITTFKNIFKKYIYDFDKDLNYYLYKTSEPSTPKLKKYHHGKKLVAIDKDWNLYYR